MEAETRSSSRFFVPLIIGTSFLGFIDAAYLSMTKLMGLTLKCGTSVGCSVVANSPYSSIFGIPLSLFGAAFYLLIFFAAIGYLEYKNVTLVKGIFGLTVIGVLMSAYLTYLELFVIHAICRYCVLSAVLSVLLFVCTLSFLRVLKR